MAASRRLTLEGYLLGKTLVRPTGAQDALPLEEALAAAGSGGTPGADASTALAAAQAAQITADAAAASAASANAALPLKAPLASPTFTGVPSAPTAAPGTDTTQLATMAAVQAAIMALVNGAPATLDTLAAVAAAIGNDAAFSASIATALGLKAPLASPTFTGVPAGPTAAPDTDTTQLATTAFARAAAAAAAAAALLNIPASDVLLASGEDLQTAIDQGSLGGSLGSIAASAVTNDSGLPGSSVAAALVALAAAKLDTTGNIAQLQVDGLVGALAAKQDKAPSAPVDFSGQRGINLATPAAASDAATKAYVDSVAQGLSPKGSCRAATTANVTLSGAQTIDGVALVAGDRVLVKNQAAPAQNGIYVVAAGAWSRASDMDTWAETLGGFTFVVSGSTQGSTSWVSQATAGGTLDTTPITFTQSNSAGSYSFNGRPGPAFMPAAGDYSAAQITGISAYGQSLIDDADAAAARATLGLGAAATRAIGTTAGTVPDGADPRFVTTSSFLNAQGAGGAIAVALAQTEVAIGSVTITPSSATSKVQIFASAEFTKDTGTTTRTGVIRVRRGTLASSPQVGQDGQGLSQPVASTKYVPRSVAAIDAPGVATAVTYTLFATVLTAGASTAARYEITAFELRASGGTGTFDQLTAWVGRGAGAIGVSIRDRLERGLGGINIEWLGAIGDNSTDCAPALNAAIALFQITGAPVYVPPTPLPFLLKSRIDLPPKLMIFGSSPPKYNLASPVPADYAGYSCLRLDPIVTTSMFNQLTEDNRFQNINLLGPGKASGVDAFYGNGGKLVALHWQYVGISQFRTAFGNAQYFYSIGCMAFECIADYCIYGIKDQVDGHFSFNQMHSCDYGVHLVDGSDSSHYTNERYEWNNLYNVYNGGSRSHFGTCESDRGGLGGVYFDGTLAASSGIKNTWNGGLIRRGGGSNPAGIYENANLIIRSQWQGRFEGWSTEYGSDSDGGTVIGNVTPKWAVTLAGNHRDLVVRGSGSDGYNSALGGGALNDISTSYAGRMNIDVSGAPKMDSGAAVKSLTASGTSFSPNGDGGATTFTYTLTGAGTVGAPTNMSIGCEYTFIITQNGTGAFGLTWNAAYTFGTAWSNTGNTANKSSIIKFIATSATTMRQSSPQIPYA